MPAVSSEDNERPLVVEQTAIEAHPGPAMLPAGYEEPSAVTPAPARGHKSHKHSRAAARANERTMPPPEHEHEHEHKIEPEHEHVHEQHETESEPSEEETIERTPTDSGTRSPIAEEAAVLAEDLAKVETDYVEGEAMEHEKHAIRRQKAKTTNPGLKPRTGNKGSRGQGELETEYLPDEDVQTL